MTSLSKHLSLISQSRQCWKWVHCTAVSISSHSASCLQAAGATATNSRQAATCIEKLAGAATNHFCPIRLVHLQAHIYNAFHLKRASLTISPGKMMTFLCRNVIWKDWREKREQLSNISRCNAQPTSAPFPFYYTQDWLRTVSSLLQDFIHCLGHDFLYFSNQFLLCQYEASSKKLHLPFTSTHLKLDLSYPSKIVKIH